MGSCTSCLPFISCSGTTIQVVLKLPHGTQCVRYHNGTFKSIGSIQDWIQTLYTVDWDGWVAYNDETQLTNKRSKGHCKGIVT